jgi:CubicO group peptidase (beta-lactamase class C family)
LNKIKIFFCVSILFLTVGCSQKKSNTNNATEPNKKLVYAIALPSKISTEERARITIQSESFYDSLLNGSGFNGGIIVAKGGNIIFEKYKGFINIDGQDSINAATSLHIASVSKTFTAMAVLKLQEMGKLNIEDSINRFFPAFNYPGLTVKSLLNHRSGLPNYLYFMEDTGWNKDSIIENKDVLNWLIEKKGLIKNIGSPNIRFTYCNTNFALLALIIESVSGISYAEFMKENIFDPLGMTNTFVHFKGDNKVRSKSFDWKGREIPDNFLDDVYGDKNIYSTPRDLLIWARALSDTIFLTAKSLELAYTPYSNERPGIKNYGLGWRMNIYDNGKKIIFHNGWWHGNNAAFIRVLKEDATIILISNRYARAVYKAKNLVNIFDHYFDTDDDEAENTIPSTIPGLFSVEKKPKRNSN